MKILSLLFALTLGIAASGASVFAESCPMPGKSGPGCPEEMGMGPQGKAHGLVKKCALGKFICKATKNAEELGLSGEQVKELNQLKLECRKSRILNGAQVQVASMELKGMMAPESFNLEAAKGQLQKKLALVEEMKVKELELYQKAISVLTPGQLEKFGSVKCPSETSMPKGKPMEDPMGWKQGKDPSKMCPNK